MASVAFSSVKNELYHGDNLEALKDLLPTHAGKKLMEDIWKQELAEAGIH